MFFSSKKFKFVILAVLVLYATISVLSYSFTNDPHKIFSLRYKLNKPKSEINLKTHGQSGDTKKLSPDASLREQLAYQFPYEPEKPMEKFIWQTWKVDVDDGEFPAAFRNAVLQWRDNNPQFAHKLLTDEACHELISMVYSAVPDVIKAYNAMPKSILKADFFRYLIVFARGGVYSDIDTVDLRGVHTWPSFNGEYPFFDAHREIKPKSIGMVIGIEADPDRPDWAEWYARRIQFCQWTIQAKKGHPLLGNLISRITEITLERLENGKIDLAKGKDQGSDIMDWTGPGIFTDEIFDYLNNVVDLNKDAKILNDNKHLTESENGPTDEKVAAAENKKKVNWKLFTNMESSIMIDDVLVLPITAFSPGVGHMGSKDETDPMALVRHMFRGTWKNDGSK